MPALQITPSEIVPRFGAELPPLPGDLRGWIAYRARHPRPRLAAPKPRVEPPPPQPEPSPVPKPALPLIVVRRQPKPEPVPVDPSFKTAERQLQRSRHAIVKRVIAETAREFGLTAAQIYSPRRMKEIAVPRHLAVWIASKTTPCSLSELGRAFGRRDHTTIINSIRRADKLVICNPEIAARVATIISRVSETAEPVNVENAEFLG